MEYHYNIRDKKHAVSVFAGMHHRQYSDTKWGHTRTGHCSHHAHALCGFLIPLLLHSYPPCHDAFGLLLQKDHSTAASFAQTVSDFTSEEDGECRPELNSLAIKGSPDLPPSSTHSEVTLAFRGPRSWRACPLNCSAQLFVWSSARFLIKKICPDLVFKEHVFMEQFLAHKYCGTYRRTHKVTLPNIFV